MRVIKFGGSSLSSGEQLKKVLSIVRSNSARKIVVVSAPGKRSADDIKITDLLIGCAERMLREGNADELFGMVEDRFSSLAADLGVPEAVSDEIRTNLKSVLNGDKSNPDRYMEAVKASGEDNNARLVSAYFREQGLEASYVNPGEAGLIVSNEPGNAQVLAESYERLYELRNRPGIIVFPGFFGYNSDGDVVTFSRSGSDITGSILANAVKAELYENFTDVDAVYSVNPSLVDNPREIRELTYREMRELAYAGFAVFHDEALIPAFRAGIPVHIKNTNNPAAPGTRIVQERKSSNGPVIGIASDKGFCSIYVSKYLMNREIGFGRRLLQILEEFGVSYEHVPSGIDDLTVVIRRNQLNDQKEIEILERLKTELDADEVKIEPNLALIMVVGEGMRRRVGTMARAANALGRAGVNLEMINQGSSEVSMMFGVKEKDERAAVAALYEEFFAGVTV